MKGKIIYVDFSKKEAKSQTKEKLFSRFIKTLKKSFNPISNKFHHKKPEKKNKHVL